MTQDERKRVELGMKLAAIELEFTPWLNDTDQGRPLRKHRSQLGRVVETLRGMLDGVAAQLDASGPDARHAYYATQENLLEAYRVWEFFRSKFALRHQAGYQHPLAVADEYAWACYEPMLRVAEQGRTDATCKEPPLVHLSGAFSPYAHLRGTRFTVEEPPDALNSDVFQRVVLSLPVPVVGMPWHQVGHLPDFPLLAHEVAHCVDQDFALGNEIEDHMDLAVHGLPAIRRIAWNRWGAEAFADCFATLAAGPSYISTLADFLMSAPVPPRKGLPPHPPAAVRLELTTATLDLTGFTSEADALRRGLRTSDHTDPYLQDARIIATALVTEPHAKLDHRALKDVVTFSARQQADSEAAAMAVLDRRSPRTSDVRALVASARIAFNEAPHEFIGLQGVVLKRAVDAIDDRTRAEPGHRDRPRGDRQVGAALFDLINQARGASS